MLNKFCTNELESIALKMVRQKYEVPPKVDIIKEIENRWGRVERHLSLVKGSEIAVCVGSRGIANLAAVVKAIVGKVKEKGCLPFVTPAMGSHGGATSKGQMDVLQARGITEASIGVPIRATMEVISLGEIDGIPLFVDRIAHEADGIVLVNRIKPHTNFVAPTESGLIKMMAIGLGNQIGAAHYHRLAVSRGYYEVISTAGKELLKRCKVLFGVGLVENQEHETAYLGIAPAGAIESMEIDLLDKARACLPLLPLDEIDLLIIDDMGKDISGEGIDPNVVGRDVCACGTKRTSPRVTRIFVRDLTEASEGSALGIGQADFTTQRLVDKIDFQTTAINCLTSCCPESGKIPLTFPNDREALKAAMMTLRPVTVQDLRMVYIRDTMDLSRILVSKGCLDELSNDIVYEIDDECRSLDFDAAGNLISPFK